MFIAFCRKFCLYLTWCVLPAVVEQIHFLAPTLVDQINFWAHSYSNNIKCKMKNLFWNKNIFNTKINRKMFFENTLKNCDFCLSQKCFNFSICAPKIVSRIFSDLLSVTPPVFHITFWFIYITIKTSLLYGTSRIEVRLCMVQTNVHL